MHAWIRKAALVVVVALDASCSSSLPPEDYGITETVTQKRLELDAGEGVELAKK